MATPKTVEGIDLLVPSPWDRETIADGVWLNSNSIEPIFNNDAALASAIAKSSAAVLSSASKIYWADDGSKTLKDVTFRNGDGSSYNAEFDDSGIDAHMVIPMFNDSSHEEDKELWFGWNKDNGFDFYDAEHINDMIAKARAAGFFVTYNHPDWSLEEYPEYSKYTGMNAMEIRNGSCAIGTGYDDDNGKVYNAMLNRGNRIFAVGADDNHNGHPDTSPSCDSYAACVWIAAEKLEYRAVTKALLEGRFYASSGNYMNEGPRILGVSFDDETRTAEIRTTGALSVALLTDTRSFVRRSAPEDAPMTSATFRISPAVG